MSQSSAAPLDPSKMKFSASGPREIEERNIRNFIRLETGMAAADLPDELLEQVMAPVIVLHSTAMDELERLLHGRPAPERPFSVPRERFSNSANWAPFQAFKNLKNHERTMEEIYGVGDMVIGRFRCKGIVDGDFYGLMGHGVPIVITEVFFVKYDDQGRMAEGWFRADVAGLLSQFGMKVVGDAATPGHT